MTRTGLLGGTFDPLHNGHVKLVEAALRSGLDRVIVMPAGRPPHKAVEIVSMAGYRYEMARKAFAGRPQIDVSDLEISRPGKSYTLDTVAELKRRNTDQELYLIYGSDILTQIESWHQPEAIMAACPILLAHRGGYSDEETVAKADRLAVRYGARIKLFDAPVIDLSSTQIKQSIRAGKPYRQWLPDTVASVIEKNGLYQHQAELEQIESGEWQIFYELERQLWPLLDRKRMLHSLNVLMYSLHLAAIHGVSSEKAGIAALLHDCAKCLPEDDLRQLAGDDPAVQELNVALIHGPAGCKLASELFGIVDAEILHAILYHTTGCAGMSKLDQIIFIADKVEPARTYANLNEIRRLAEYDLDEAMLVCLQEIDLFLSREKLPPHPLTREAYAEIHDRLARRAETNNHEEGGRSFDR